MFRLSLVTVIGVTVLALLFQVAHGPTRYDYSESYRKLVGDMLEAQGVQAEHKWRLGPAQGPLMPATEGDYVVLSPWSVDWSRTHAEGRSLSEAPPEPVMPRPVVPEGMETKVVAEGYVQTDWQLMRVRSTTEHRLAEAVAGGTRLSGEIASFCTDEGMEPELLLYQCHAMPFRVYRLVVQVRIPPSSEHPMGVRPMEAGQPWVVFGEPFVSSQTWCKASFVEDSPVYRDRVPSGRYALPVREPDM